MTARDDDRRLASALLLHLVVLHPTELTEAALVGELNGKQDNPGERAATEAVLEELVADGLVERRDGKVLASRAALRAYELWEG